MKKNMLVALILILILSLTGCSAFRNSFSKGLSSLGAHDYKITQWSGGVAVREYTISNSYVNSEDTSDGWYFFYKGALVRLSGTITIEEI